MLSPEHRHVRDDDPRRTGFAFPPATETQVQETEDRLELSLPPILRSCYTELANGGFGLAYGLRGVIGGYDHMGNLLEYYQSLCKGREVVELDIMTASRGGIHVFEISFEQWVRAALPLIDEGCAMKLCLDVTSGSIFRVEGSSTGYAFTYIAPTFETLLGLWLSDEIYPRKARARL